MKKIFLVILLFISIILLSMDSYAVRLNDGKSSFWQSSYATPNYLHIGNYRVSGNRIWEGLMFYESATIYEYEVSNDVFLSYVTTLYPEVTSYNYELSVGIEKIVSSYVTPPSTTSINFTLGRITPEYDIDNMNIGVGIKRTYTEILVDSEIDIVKYKIKPNSNFLDSYVKIGATFDPGNATLAVYAKTIKVIEHKIKIRQTGPINNVYWILDGYSKTTSEMLLDLALLPITSSYRNNFEVNQGTFYLNYLDLSLRGYYSTQ